MKKVININFQGRVVPIEETAYDILKQYVDSLRRFFENEEGKDEIINDIEGRIAELFGETLKKGNTCITDDDVNAIIRSMGRPEDFEAEESSVQTQLGANSKSKSTSAETGSTSQHTSENNAHIRPERLYRDENNKLLGGVCAGIANYFGIDKLIIRIIFVLGFGIVFIPYLILWVAVPSSASTVIGSVRKRLFRDPDNKWIAGVCGGLASYFGVNIWLPRILFLIPFLSFVTSWNNWGAFNFPNFINLSFSPGATLIYIILWLVLPEASTTSDKLEMKGEKVDLNSIKNTIQKDMEGFGDRAKEFGKEVGEKAAEIGTKIGERGKQVGAEASTVARRTGTTLGDVISMIFKIIAYFILAVVTFAIVAALFGLGIGATGLLPLKAYFITDGWQDLLTWGVYILFIWVPVVGVITWIIRRIAKVKSNSNAMRFGFAAMWIAGWVCLIALIASLKADFSYHNTPSESSLALTDPAVNKLELKLNKDNRYYFNNTFLHLEPFASIDEDTAYVQNIHIRVLKSDDDSFHVTMLKMVNGASKAEAEVRAERMKFDIVQKDTFLLFDRGIPVPKVDKFRNQTVYVTMYVPVGKRILIRDNIGWGNDVHVQFGNDLNDWDWRNNDEGYNWSDNVEYIMHTDGLKRVHPEEIENSDMNNDDNTDAPNTDTLRNDKDSNKYHYQPAHEEQPAKSEIKAELSPAIQKHFINIDFHDLAATFLGSATI